MITYFCIYNNIDKPWTDDGVAYNKFNVKVEHKLLQKFLQYGMKSSDERFTIDVLYDSVPELIVRRYIGHMTPETFTEMNKPCDSALFEGGALFYITQYYDKYIVFNALHLLHKLPKTSDEIMIYTSLFLTIAVFGGHVNIINDSDTMKYIISAINYLNGIIEYNNYSYYQGNIESFLYDITRCDYNPRYIRKNNIDSDIDSTYLPKTKKRFFEIIKMQNIYNPKEFINIILAQRQNEFESAIEPNISFVYGVWQFVPEIKDEIIKKHIITMGNILNSISTRTEINMQDISVLFRNKSLLNELDDTIALLIYKKIKNSIFAGFLKLLVDFDWKHTEDDQLTKNPFI